MRFGEIHCRADGDDARGINLGVRHVVMTLDVIEINSVGDAWLLIQIHQKALQIWIVDDTAQVAFEMAVVDGVETNKRAKKSPVRLDNSAIKQVSAFRQTLFELIQRLKNSATRSLVRPLARRKTSSVDTVVDIVV